MLTMNRLEFDHHAVLRSQIRLSTRFITELLEHLRTLKGDTYERQELSAAVLDFRWAKEKAEKQLAALPAQPSLDESAEHRRRLNEATEAQQVASTVAFIDRLRAMGDFRQAKIHYGSLLQIRRTIEHETS